MPQPIEKEKPERCRNPKGWAWRYGDVGYMYHPLFECWIRLNVIKTSGHQDVIFRDEGGITYIQKAWTKSVFPLQEEQNTR